MYNSLSAYSFLRVIIISILILLKTNWLNAQDAVFSQFMFNQLVFNPAFAGIKENPRVTGGYRNQWPTPGNGFVDYYVSYDQYGEKIDGGIGFSASRDLQGPGVFSETRFNLMYSYPVAVSRHLNVNLGFQAGITQKSIHASGLLLTQNDPFLSNGGGETLTDQASLFPDFAAGAIFNFKEQYEFNFSVDHLNIIKTPNTGSNFFYMLPLRFTFQLFSQYPAKPPVKQKVPVFHPGFMTQIQESYVYLNYGCNVTYAPLMAGLWLRNNLKFKVNTFVLLAGYSWEGLSLRYSYDFWTPKTYEQLKIYAAHEVTFEYLFKYNDPKKKMRALKCPIF